MTPSWLIESLDREAGRLGVTRQSIITVWLAERLEQTASGKWIELTVRMQNGPRGAACFECVGSADVIAVEAITIGIHDSHTNRRTTLPAGPMVLQT